jgi:hypothetical protein
MTPKLTNELRDAVQQNAGKAVEVEDDQQRLYVLMTRQEFERVVYDDSDLTEDEMRAAAAQGLVAESGWGAADLDAYDQSGPDSSQP